MNLFELEQRKGFPYITGLYALESYAAAYWRAAKSMIDYKIYKGDGRPDFSAFPIVFLYRQALELMIKAILVEHHETYSADPKTLLDASDRGHKLPDVYVAELRSVVDRALVFADGEAVITVTDQEWSSLQNVLKDWRDQDPDGMAFRYSIDKKAKRPLTSPNLTFNMEGFAQRMEEVL
jgi:hypothetical protein